MRVAVRVIYETLDSQKGELCQVCTHKGQDASSNAPLFASKGHDDDILFNEASLVLYSLIKQYAEISARSLGINSK